MFLVKTLFKTMFSKDHR